MSDVTWSDIVGYKGDNCPGGHVTVAEIEALDRLVKAAEFWVLQGFRGQEVIDALAAVEEARRAR